MRALAKVYSTCLSYGVLFLLASTNVAATDGALPPGPYVSTSGEARIEQMPDFALIQVSISGEGESATKARNALDENALELNALLESFSEAIGERRVQTVGVNPQFRLLDRGDRELKGYRAEQTLTIQINDLTRLNAFYYRLAGINTAGLNTPTYHLENESAVRDRARKLALEDAHRNAQMLANAQDTHLGPIWGIVYRSMHTNAGRFSTGFGRTDDESVSLNLSMSRGLAIPLKPQPIPYAATVGVIYRIEQAASPR